MKKLIIILCLFVSVANQAQAQTKEETEKWLTEKMMKAGFFGDDKITKVQFDDNFLTIKGTSSSDSKRAYDGKVMATTKSTFYYTIDLSKLSNDVYKFSNYISTNNNSIKKNIITEKYGYNQGSWGFLGTNESNGYLDYVPMGIVENVEPDILERFKKALKHYQSLMTVKKSSETF